MENEFTLSTGKVVTTKEITAYQRFNMSKFITGTVNSEAAQIGEISAAYMEQSSMLAALFAVDEVDGEKVKTPTDQKTLILAFNNFNGAEFEEYMKEYNSRRQKAGVDPGKSSTGSDKDGSLSASESA